MGFSHNVKNKRRKKHVGQHCAHRLVSLQACHLYRGYGCDKVTPSPSSFSSSSTSSPDSLYSAGGWGGCVAWTRQIVLVCRRPSCKRRRGGRLSLWGFGPLASSCLACLALWSCSMTAQGNITAGGACVCVEGGEGVLVVVVVESGSVSFVYSCFFHLVQLPSYSSHSSISSSTLSSSIPPWLFRCSVSETPSSSLKKSCAAARHPGLQPGGAGAGCRKRK